MNNRLLTTFLARLILDFPSLDLFHSHPVSQSIYGHTNSKVKYTYIMILMYFPIREIERLWSAIAIFKIRLYIIAYFRKIHRFWNTIRWFIRNRKFTIYRGFCSNIVLPLSFRWCFSFPQNRITILDNIFRVNA